MTEAQPQAIGWREWVALPQLGIERLKVKVDTGARSSALHAYFVEPFTRDGKAWVRFGIHPHQNDETRTVICEAAVHDRRKVRDSGGHEEVRPVILTEVHLGERRISVEVTLTNRDSMKFRMLLGRTALKSDYLVAPAESYLLGEPR
ncbi:ATP-dependent zinc protease family protein [Motiliproteus sediminis]|uniref:ATP-dependent zinc protease family protein n=1 Tax=Motiliproteus sediminis TaxID=1468178 RepID=UPI001AEF880F|nr:ATP-dependent zinc protease [Motiliproteus sediminis]